MIQTNSYIDEIYEDETYEAVTDRIDDEDDDYEVYEYLSYHARPLKGLCI